MENRSKFWSRGAWVDDKRGDRLEHINWVIKAYQDNNLDKQELKFIIKNAFVSKIYVSERVVDEYNSQKYSNLGDIFGNNLLRLYEKLIKEGVLKFGDEQPNNCVFFDICKLSDRISNYNNRIKKQSNNKIPKIIIEHVIPGEEYMKTIIKDPNPLNQNEFNDIFDAVSICLVTEDDDNKLDKKLRQRMPDNYRDCFTKHPFARYDVTLGGADIDVWGWEMKNGQLEKKILIF